MALKDISRSFPARCVMAVLAGGIYALAYPPWGWGWLVLPGIAGLVWTLRGEKGTRARGLGFLHGMTAYAVSFSWLLNLFGGMAVALWCVLAAFTALFAEMQSRAERRGFAGWKFACFTAINWCGWEFIRAELFPLKFPWMTAGLGIGPNILLPWIGVYGAGMVVVVAAGLLTIDIRKFAVIPVVVLLVSVLLCRRFPEPAESDPLSVKIAGIQLEGVTLDDFLAETRKLPAGIQQVTWPEYAVPYDIQADARDMGLVGALCRERAITLTFGTQSRPAGGESWRNIALTMDPTGILGEHQKVHPVHLFDDGVAGKICLPVSTGHGKIGTPICFDYDYEGVVRKMTAAGAEMIFAPTMDAKSWTAAQHDQHSALSRIRACENGRWIFVCATSGVSQVIDPHGHVHARLGALEQGTITGIMRREKTLTFYTRFGWLVPWCVLVFAAGCWLLLLWPRKRSGPFPA